MCRTENREMNRLNIKKKRKEDDTNRRREKITLIMITFLYISYFTQNPLLHSVMVSIFSSYSLCSGAVMSSLKFIPPSLHEAGGCAALLLASEYAK